MKILVVCQFYYPENFVITNVCENLVKQGNDVTVLTGKPNYGYGYILPEYKIIKYEEINGVKVHRVNIIARKKTRLSIIRNYLSFWKNSKKWVRNCKEKFDIVYSMSLSPVTILSAGNLYKKKHHVKHVVHCVDLWPESVLVTHAVRKNSLVYRLLYRWSRSLYSKVDHVILGSPSFKQYFDEVLKLPNLKTSYIPQPSLVEENDIAPFKYDGGINILYCGNLGKIQLTELIPEAMKEVSNPNIKFHLIGMGPMTSTIQKEIKDYHLEGKVIYHGPIPTKKAAAYFKSADALFVSLNSKGFVGKTIPNKLVMYMSFAKPIIAMLAGDGKKILEESQGAIIVEQNAESLKRGIEQMATMSKEEKEKLGHNNQAYFKNHFTIDIIGDAINKVLLDELR